MWTVLSTVLPFLVKVGDIFIDKFVSNKAVRKKARESLMDFAIAVAPYVKNPAKLMKAADAQMDALKEQLKDLE